MQFKMIISAIFLILFSVQMATAKSASSDKNKNNIKRNVQAMSMDGVLWTPPDFSGQKALGYDSKAFEVPKPLKDDVKFWIMIYTKYTTKQGIFHVAGDTNRILGEIDLTNVYLNPKWGPIRREKEAELLIERKRRALAKKHNLKDSKSVRLQMGLKDRMEHAIFESGKYLPMMEKVFVDRGLPKELTRVVFVESSFNTEARSKVGASGLWQIMPAVGKKYKYLQKNYDKRDHPLYATKLAADIFKQNYNILDCWPLAVTSYNFGVGSMLKVRKKMGTTDSDKIFASENVKKHIGFASRNFYATFLAALHVEAHANLYFGEPFMVARPLELNEIYLAKDMKYNDLLLKYKLEPKKFAALNPHINSKFLKLGKVLPKGTLVSVPDKSSVKTADSSN